MFKEKFVNSETLHVTIHDFQRKSYNKILRCSKISKPLTKSFEVNNYFKNLFPKNVPILSKSANAVMCPPGICSIALMLIHFQTAKDNKRESGFR